MVKRNSLLATLTITTAVGFAAIAPLNVLQVLAADKFIDIENTAASKLAIQELAKQNVLSGYSDTEFKPNQNVTRGELAKIAALSMYVNLNTDKKLSFQDVQQSDWSFSYINALVNAGIMKADNDRFQPGATVSHEQLVETAAALLKQDKAAVQILFGSSYTAGKAATRAETAQLFYAVQQAAIPQITQVKVLNAVAVQITFSAPLTAENTDVEKAKQNFVFSDGLMLENIPQLKTGAKATYIVPTSPQKAGTNYTVAYKGQKSGSFIGSDIKIPFKAVEQVAADTIELQSYLADGVTDYQYIIALYSGKRNGLDFTVDDNNTYNGKPLTIIPSMRLKQVTLTDQAGASMTATYVPFTQSTDGKQEPKFRLANGETLKSGSVYTLSAPWATFGGQTLTAKSISPLAIQKAEAVSATSINVTLTADPQDELFAGRSVTLTAPDGTKLTAQYKFTSRQGAVGVFDIQNNGKLISGVTYSVAAVNSWADSQAVTLTGVQ
ncbi:S-layer homology domain-containing protein [Paenibacillus sp. WQ 127069]|uniref:S-layer homology domain-containing protein n=1 Tax=Paenibacillus baimaensis TaxID=2982185 RepID=A0ABT2UU13_9BACL|nr:S-layer homology domain-containing protein [Paenibacillus sp. WQ 127069]MCU6798145.1 S-layer homology domain-containing protein [Paenibacillus sp. WQ 127069]